MKILWLASWYPDRIEPANGDFIKRNAEAVSTILPLTVIHVLQSGSEFNSKNKFTASSSNNLTEWIVEFAYRKTKIRWLNKIIYHTQYKRCYKKVLLDYESKFGKPDLIHVHIPMKAGLLAMKFSRRWNCPYIVSEHSSMYAASAIDHFKKRSFFFKMNTKKIFRNAALVTNVSKKIAVEMDKLFNLPSIKMIPNLVDTKFFYYKPVTNEKFRFIHVSSILPQKNIREIIAVFKDLNTYYTNWELIVVGPFSNEIENEIIQLKLDNQIFQKGELYYADVAAEMQKANALVLFSVQENFPCVIIEALCCGLPVISSDTGGVSEAINKKNGLLVEVANKEALLYGLMQIVNNYKNYNRKEIAEKACLLYADIVIANQIREIYEIQIQPKTDRYLK